MKIDFSLLEEQILLRMKFDNPWWSTGMIPEDFHDMRHRLYLSPFYQRLMEQDVRRAILLMGPRRVGKTVMLYHTIEKLIADGVNPQRIIYLSIDTPIYNNLSLEMLFGMARKALLAPDANDEFYVFYDEIQYLKDWEVHLKSLVDTYRHTHFVASGSASAALRMKSMESGVGRFSDFMLPPLTFQEYIHLLNLGHLIVQNPLEWNGQIVDFFDTIDLQQLNQHFLNYINYGGYPEIVFSSSAQMNPSQFIRHDIVDKVMLRDLPSLYGIKDTQELYRLFVHIVFRSGGEFSYDDLSKESGIKKETLKKYIQYLEAAFLIKVVHRVDQNARRFQREVNFKIYITNPALRCALFSPISTDDVMMGNMVETAIYAQWIQQSGTEVYYANWKQGRQSGEVDMVGLNVKRQKACWAVEIKWSDLYYEQPSKLKSLLTFMETNDLPSAVVTSIQKFKGQKMQKIFLQFVPASIYAYVVGYNTISQKSNIPYASFTAE